MNGTDQGPVRERGDSTTASAHRKCVHEHHDLKEVNHFKVLKHSIYDAPTSHRQGRRSEGSWSSSVCPKNRDETVLTCIS